MKTDTQFSSNNFENFHGQIMHKMPVFPETEITKRFDALFEGTAPYQPPGRSLNLLFKNKGAFKRIASPYDNAFSFKAYIQEVLSEFHAVFQFDVFFMMIEEASVVRPYLYYFGHFSDEIKTAFKQKILDHRPLHHAIEEIEFEGCMKNKPMMGLEYIHLFQERLPENLSEPEVLLGFAHASARTMSHSERGILRFLLSVISMIANSKRQSDSNCGLYQQSLSTKSIKRPELHQAEALQDALKQNKIVPLYQPIIDCKTGKLFANAASAHFQDGCMPCVIDRAGKHDLAAELDKFILKKALIASKDHLFETGDPARIFIRLAAPISPENSSLSFAQWLCRELSLPPSCFIFEIAEHDAVEQIPQLRQFLRRLRNQGFCFALNQFGSSCQSIQHLKQLNFDYVKIDSRIVGNILNSSADKAYVHTLSQVCSDLGILTVAESADSECLLDALQEIGIDYAQSHSKTSSIQVLN